MPQWDEAGLTGPQRQWFATLRDNLERETGRDLAAWAELARACPETRHRARLAWMKATYGLGQNRASAILAAAFPDPPAGQDAGDPLWRDPAARAIFDAVLGLANDLPDVVVGRRKGFTAFSRRYQFAAARPSKAGGVRLGLAVPPDAEGLSPRTPAEPWSERLLSVLDLAGPEQVDAAVAQRLRQAARTA